MKTIGLIGGMSWESTMDYYRILNQTVKEALGGFHSAQCLLYSVDFHDIEACQEAGDWERSGDILADAARRLERGGADLIVLCTNTMHKVADKIQGAVNIPFLHIAEVTAEALLGQNVVKAALLGTKYTMEQDFYKERLQARGIQVMIPGPEDRGLINHVIFNELCLGKTEKKSREAFLRIIDSLQAQGAQGIILGCTEIGMLVKPQDTPAALFDTTEIHARKAALIAIE